MSVKSILYITIIVYLKICVSNVVLQVNTFCTFVHILEHNLRYAYCSTSTHFSWLTWFSSGLKWHCFWKAEHLYSKNVCFSYYVFLWTLLQYIDTCLVCAWRPQRYWLYSPCCCGFLCQSSWTVQFYRLSTILSRSRGLKYSVTQVIILSVTSSHPVINNVINTLVSGVHLMC